MPEGGSPAASELGFDPEALKRKYSDERAKRVGAAAGREYRLPEGELASYLRDPYTTDDRRTPVDEDVEALVVGAGFAGLLAAARLKERGVSDVRILDRAGDFGGTWYWNRYPGAACDVESYIYMPLLEELGVVPTEKYAKGPEIFAHAQAIGRAYDLYPRALFHTTVASVRWSEELKRWVVKSDRGDTIRARFLYVCTGVFPQPKLPGVPGIESFKGHAFHTSRWDYAYTGGDPYSPLDGLTDKRVGLIGTGATAVQAVPALGASAKSLHVFQRTPSAVDVRGNRLTDPDWARALTPGWQAQRMDNFERVISGMPVEEDLVGDGWTEVLAEIGIQVVSLGADAERRQMADYRKMERVRARIDAVVADKATAEALKPWYNTLCKRPCFHDEYLATFNRPNVTLVDTQGRGVDRITERGVVVGGREYELDCLIYATGFEYMTEDFARRSGYDIEGRGGLKLTEKWKDGLATLHGYFTRGFPNCFFLGNGQSANTASYTRMVDLSAQHLAHVVAESRQRGALVVEPTEAGEGAWVEHILSFARERTAYDLACTPGYYNNEGQPSDRLVRNSFYPAGAIAFIDLLERWRAKGDLEGLELTS